MPKGSVYGSIGRNGAGKSTTQRVICGLASPSAGEIKLFEQPVTDPTVRRKIGTLIEQPGIYQGMSALENVILQGYSIVAIFVCGDYAGGFAKNIFVVHADPKDYVGGKMLSMAVISGLMLALYTIICLIALPILGYDVALSGGVLGVVVFLFEKWRVGCALSAVVLLVSFFTRNMAWTMFVEFLIATGGLTMGISLFA